MDEYLTKASNAEYHKDNTHLSSSSIKMLLKNPAQYYQEYILGNKSTESRPQFDEGSFVHTLVLEPEKVADYAVFPGLRKSGKAWEEFQAANKGKIILSAPQVNRCEQLYKSYASLPVATALLQGGSPEFTMTGKMLDVPVKARADYINIDKKYIVDIKTTSMPSDSEIFRHTIREYGYDLSAALYCQIAHDNFNSLFDFYWIVISKSDMMTNVYKASSQTLSEGAALVTAGLVLYKKCKASGVWDFEQPRPSFDSADYEVIEL